MGVHIPENQSQPLSPDLQISVRSPDLQISSPCLAVADIVQAHGRHAPPSLTSPPTILQVCDRGWWGAAFLVVIAARHAGKLQALVYAHAHTQALSRALTRVSIVWSRDLLRTSRLVVADSK